MIKIGIWFQDVLVSDVIAHSCRGRSANEEYLIMFSSNPEKYPFVQTLEGTPQAYPSASHIDPHIQNILNIAKVTETMGEFRLSTDLGTLTSGQYGAKYVTLDKARTKNLLYDWNENCCKWLKGE